MSLTYERSGYERVDQRFEAAGKRQMLHRKKDMNGFIGRIGVIEGGFV